MKNHNQMTLEECCRELSRYMGWTVGLTLAIYDGPRRPHPTKPDTAVQDGRLEYVASINSIAACMPEGYEWRRWSGNYSAFPNDGWHDATRNTKNTVWVSDTGNERLDRARLSVACHRAIRATQGKE